MTYPTVHFVCLSFRAFKTRKGPFNFLAHNLLFIVPGSTVYTVRVITVTPASLDTSVFLPLGLH